MAGLLLVLVASLRSAAGADPREIQFNIDLTRDVHPISRFVYGVNRKLEGPWADCTFERVGGNRWTAYNWTNNASNAGSDYRFQNDGYLGGGDSPGGAVIPYIEAAAEHNAAVLLTIPINGYVSADKRGDGDVHASGADYLHQRFRPERPRKDAPFTLTPDSAAPAVYQDEFVHWVKTRFSDGFINLKRPIWFSLDNEPDLWSSTHKEIHPEPTRYSELIDKSIDHAAAIKAQAPNTLVFGPANYGWQGFQTLQNAPDAGHRDFQAVYLAAMARAERERGERLLDVLDVHWYPEASGGGVRIIGGEKSPEVRAARVQAPRSLWDEGYTETSWITKSSTKGPIRLLQRLHEKVDANYPGTKLAITEYNFGGGDDISGAIAEAEVLGVFGREGVFAAAEWPLGRGESFIAAAFNSFLDFDGKHGHFGDTSVFARASDASDAAIYASVDSTAPGRVVLVVINRSESPQRATFSIAHAAPLIRAHRWELNRDAPEVHDAGELPLLDGNRFECTLSGYSVSTIALESK